MHHHLIFSVHDAQHFGKYQLLIKQSLIEVTVVLKVPENSPKVSFKPTLSIKKLIIITENSHLPPF